MFTPCYIASANYKKKYSGFIRYSDAKVTPQSLYRSV